MCGSKEAVGWESTPLRNTASVSSHERRRLEQIPLVRFLGLGVVAVCLFCLIYLATITPLVVEDFRCDLEMFSGGWTKKFYLYVLRLLV